MHDLEAAQRSTGEQAEAHQAEEPRLGWSKEQGRWIPGSNDEPLQRQRASSTSDNSSSLVEEQLTSSSLSRKSRDPQEGAATHGSGSHPARGISTLSNEPIYVQFEDDDPENPFEWSRRRKWIITGIGAWLTTLVAIAGPGFNAGVTPMQAELGTSHVVSSIAFGVYPLGFGVGPLLLAPLSEVYGRNPMYRASFVIFTLLYLPLALSSSIAVICVFRFLSGVAGSVGSTMVGGTIADIWQAKERGRPMALFSIGAFAGTGIGPAVFSYVAQEIGWRWIEWIQMMMAGVTTVVVLLFFRETRGNVILSKRAAALRKKHNDDRYQCRADEERASIAVLMKTGVSRPVYFLFTEPIVMSLSIWVGFAWGCMYGLVQAVPLVYRNVYGWTLGQSGLAFIAVIVGAFLGYALNNVQEVAYKKYHPTKGMEARLWGSMLGGLTFAVGSLIFAWAIKGHWIGPLIALALLISGIYAIYQGVFVYLADAYTIYASSAMSSQSFARNLSGFIFPLFTVQMYNNLGYSWAAFLLSMIAFLLSVIPFILYRYGEKIRARSPAAIALALQLEEAERKRAERAAAREKRAAAQSAGAGGVINSTPAKAE